MMGKLIAIWVLVVLAIAYPAIAQEELPPLDDLPPLPPLSEPGSYDGIPRLIYFPERWQDRPASFKTDDLRAQDEAKANANEAACMSGTAAACADLGESFYLGEGRPQNRPVAQLLFEKACFADVGKGCFKLGALLQRWGLERQRPLAAEFHARACRLDWLEGCDAEADALAAGELGDPNPFAAEALRRATCQRGGLSACRTLAQLLMGDDRSVAEQSEGIALIDRQCRIGDLASCEAAERHWRSSDQPGSAAKASEYGRLACEAGNGELCLDLGKAELASANDPAGMAAALMFLDRACVLSEYQCPKVADVRNLPVLDADCKGGDMSACIALGQILSKAGGLVEDRDRAVEVFSATCEAGMVAGCWPAANLIFERWKTIGPSGATRAARVEAYLSASCAVGHRDACEKLADELVDGEKLTQDLPRAIALFYPQCDYGRGLACDQLERLTSGDPAAPLIMAHAGFTLDLTIEEQLDLRPEGSKGGIKGVCTTTTVAYENHNYTDKWCQPDGGYGLEGFSIRMARTPWQALLWRPERLGGTKLEPAQRVLCGGTVIRKGWVLTAAHCLTDEGGVSIKNAGHRIRLGLSNPLVDEGVSHPILRVIPHPDYDRKTYAFDVALVQYDTTRRETARKALPITAIRLDPQPLGQRKLEATPRVFTFGWGVTALQNGEVPDHLRGFRLSLRNAAACTSVTKFTDSKRRDSVLCADEAKGQGGGQACYGDSGGPLITYGDSDNVPTLIGVVSSGVDCGTIGKPSRYVRIAHPRVKAWLDQILPPPGAR